MKKSDKELLYQAISDRESINQVHEIMNDPARARQVRLLMDSDVKAFDSVVKVKK